MEKVFEDFRTKGIVPEVQWVSAAPKKAAPTGTTKTKPTNDRSAAAPRSTGNGHHTPAAPTDTKKPKPTYEEVWAVHLSDEGVAGRFPGATSDFYQGQVTIMLEIDGEPEIYEYPPGYGEPSHDTAAAVN